jgi:hypothetical protein
MPLYSVWEVSLKIFYWIFIPLEHRVTKILLVMSWHIRLFESPELLQLLRKKLNSVAEGQMSMPSRDGQPINVLRSKTSAEFKHRSCTWALPSALNGDSWTEATDKFESWTASCVKHFDFCVEENVNIDFSKLTTLLRRRIPCILACDTWYILFIYWNYQFWNCI